MRAAVAVRRASSERLVLSAVSMQPQPNLEEGSVHLHLDPCWTFCGVQPFSRHRRAPSETEGFEEDVQGELEDHRLRGDRRQQIADRPQHNLDRRQQKVDEDHRDAERQVSDV